MMFTLIRVLRLLHIHLVPSNQYKIYNDDDDDIFASISTQEILHEDVQKMCKEVKLDEEAPGTSKKFAAAAPRRNWRPLSLNPKFNGPRNEQIAQGMIFLIFHYAFIIKIRDETIFKLIQNFLDLVPSNQYKIYNYDWDDDDDDISSQDVKMNNSFSINNFPHTSKFPVNKQITQKASGERPELGVDKDAVGVSEISNKNETEEMKRKVNRDEVGKVNNPESSLVSAGFQTANGKTISISEESKRSVQNILREFQDNLQETNYETELKDMKARMQSKFGKTVNNSGQIAKKTPFEAICKEVKLDEEAPGTSKKFAAAAPCRKWRGLSLNPKFNRPRNEQIAGFQKVSGERPELGEGKNEISAGFQTANGKTISISEESKRSVQNILREFQDNLQETNYETELKDIKARMSIKSMQSKFGKTGNSSAQIAKKTDV
ncbi:uncharacterized protein ACN427_013631 isoform 1-T1 [Glossina fuscipes fuscipes]